LAHRIALKANGTIDAAATAALEITDRTVEPAEFVAVTTKRSFLVAAVAGTTRLELSKLAINVQFAGIGALTEIVAVVGQVYHLYSVVIGPVPVQVPTLAVMVRPAITEVGLKLGATVLVGATLIGPNDAENVAALSVPTLLVAVRAVTLATKCLPTNAFVRSSELAVAPEISEQLSPRRLAAVSEELHEYHW
jgi:hypothetical protein